MARRKRKSKKRRSKKSKRGGKTFKTDFKSAVARDTERQKQARKSYGYLKLPSGVPVFNPEPKSKIKLDFIPYVVTDENHPDRYEEEGIAVPDTLWYKRPFKIHRNIGVERDAVVCLRSAGKQCPICEYREKQMRSGGDQDTIKELKPSLRNLYVVIPVRSKQHDEIPHVWDMSQFLFQELLNEELNEDEENAIFPDLENGKTLRIRFDSSRIGSSRPFAEASRIDFYDRKKSYGTDILDDVPNLDDMLEIFTYDELEAKFLEIEDEDMSDDYPEESGSRRRSIEPEDEDWEDEEWEDEDWEDEEEFEEEPDEDWEDEDWEDEDWEDEDWEDEDWEDEDWEDEEEFEDEPEPEPKKSKPKRTRKSKPKRTRKSKPKRKRKK